MRNNKILGITIAALGLALLLFSIFLDDIGIGRTPGFGLGQIAGTIVGAALYIYGLFRMRKN